MARIRLRLGPDEIEIDSRDIYVDNQTIGDVIDHMARYLSEGRARLEYIEPAAQIPQLMHSLEDAEVREPEFAEVQHVPHGEIKPKIEDLERSGFFDLPRTVAETTQKLRKDGWDVRTLDLSKILVSMSSDKKLVRDFAGGKASYSTKGLLVAS